MKGRVDMKKIISLFLAVLLIMSLLLGVTAESWMPEWDREVDVVVVGFGPAGAMAAKSAQENGASVLVVEKESKEFAGGSAAASMGFVFDPYTGEMLYNHSYGRLTTQNAQRIADKANANIEWLYENGLEMQGRYAVGNGMGFYSALAKNIEALGIEVLYQTPAKKLVYEPITKEVYGVICSDASGSALKIKANKGVILCTGGYVANEDLMNRFHFTDMPELATIGAPGQTGDGLLMALEVGAAIDGVTNQQIEWYGLAYKKASDEMGTGILHLLNGLAPDARIFVNTNGERFMNEELYLIHNKSQLEFFAFNGDFPIYGSYKNLPMYTIMDSTMIDADAVGPRDYIGGFASAHNIYNWSADNQAEVERGWLVKADTIDELVEKLAEQSGKPAINTANLKKTIETYNTYCDQGEDKAFGRDSFYLSKIETPPYYAAQIVPCSVYTIGGLWGGENGETLDWTGNPIKRLYHAGDIGQPTKMMMACLQGAMALGEIAGEACAQLKPIDQ